MKVRLAAILLLILAFLGGTGWLVYRQMEWHEAEHWTGYQGEARTNPFLAAQRLLERSGRKAVSFRGLPLGRRLPPPEDVLILPAREVHLTPGQAAELAGWVAQGGLLVCEGMVPDTPERPETRDALLDAFGLRYIPVPPPAGEASPPPALLEFQVDEQPLTIEVSPDGVFEDPLDAASGAAGDERGLRVVRVAKERGAALFFTTLGILRNERLSGHDHADLLAALPAQRPPSARVWIVTHEVAPSLIRWLLDRAWMVLLSGAALAMALLAAAAPRFGPLRASGEAPRRSLLEHLAAVGRFQWRHRGGKPLLLAARTALDRRLALRHPAWKDLPADERCRRLAEISGLPESDVFHALRYDLHPDPRDFTRALRTLDLLRKQL